MTPEAFLFLVWAFAYAVMVCVYAVRGAFRAYRLRKAKKHASSNDAWMYF